MKPLVVMFATFSAAVLMAGCRAGEDRPRGAAASAPANPMPPADKEWTADEISRDPTTYMKWADAKVARQIADRDGRLARVNARLEETRRRQKALSLNMEEIENLRTRLEQASQRATDEDRWPFRLAGESFDQARARTVIAETRRYADDRKPMLAEYEKAVAKLDDAAVALRRDIENLQRLREKLALDLERIRLSQGVEELAALRKTEAEIEGYSRALGQIADDVLMSTSALSERDADVPAGAFLKPRRPDG
jgi:chromosome segregation ATPase